MRFETPTPIQVQAIPLALEGKDIIGSSQTGTGKTAAYAIPALIHLMKCPQKTALFLAPTRELAQQIEDVWRELTRFIPDMRSVTLIGGTSMMPQFRGLARNPRLIIATPGRLNDHLERGTAKLSQTDYMVIDEADRMLDMGFAPQLAQIQKYLPALRQTLCFTATWSSDVDKLARKFLKNPAHLQIGAVAKAANNIDQSLVKTTIPMKNETLLDELKDRKGPILVFASTQIRTDRVAKFLSSYGVSVNRIHGGRPQGQRNTALTEFRNGRIQVLVATDIAARGIDVNDISYVINYDLPQTPEDYVHRIGRTGRAGATGRAVSFVTPEDRDHWFYIVRHLKKTGSSFPTLK